MTDLAIYDKLTNVHNRRYFDEKIRIETQKSFSSHTPISLIMVDIDFFKKVNDTYGHHAGDSVLSKIASLLKSSVRKDDTVARYGGEEFVLILPGAKLEVTSIIAERIRRLVETTPFENRRRPNPYHHQHWDIQSSDPSSEVGRGISKDGGSSPL